VDRATAVPASAEFARKSNGIVTKRRTGSESVRHRGEFASQEPHFDSEMLSSSDLSAKKIKKSLPIFRSSGKPGRINPRKKSVDAFPLF
jgi:hypothetical protein